MIKIVTDTSALRKPIPTTTFTKEEQDLVVDGAFVFIGQVPETSFIKDLGITKVIIEEPLLNSNNVYTISTLMRFNTLICKEVYDILGVVPEFISTYNSRRHAFPHLVQQNDKKKFVLFGGYPKDCDKKMIIWELVAKREPQIQWHYTKNNTLKKENFDQTDAYCCVLGFMKQEEIW